MADIHENQPVYSIGTPLEQARIAMILVHGRGASAHDILTLTEEFSQEGIAYLAPQASGHTWYPNRFIAPVETNEPALSSALNKLDSLVQQVKSANISAEKIVLLGFSQGACLALEYAARHPDKYGGVIAYSGGLIGETLQYADNTDLQQTPVFLGCSDIDFHIPQERVKESADLLRQMNAEVTMRLYPGMGHTVNQDEIDFTKALLSNL